MRKFTLLLVAAALALSGCAVEEPSTDKSKASASDNAAAETAQEDNAAAEETEPAEPNPDGTYRESCDYTLSDDFDSPNVGWFIGDVTLKNTGNIGTIDKVVARWSLSGGGDVVKKRTVRSKPGQSKRVSFRNAASGDQIDRYQSLDADNGFEGTCKITVTTVGTFGEVQ